MNIFNTALFVVSALAFSGQVAAGPGHDHGDAPPAAVGEASPRVVMETDLFEAVGILKGRTLEIFIDHAASNAPVDIATLALELDGEAVPLELHNVGEFDAVLPDSMFDQNIAVALTISAGGITDVLTGELQLAGGELAQADEEHSHLLEYLAFGVLGFLALALIAVFIKRRNNTGVNQA